MRFSARELANPVTLVSKLPFRFNLTEMGKTNACDRLPRYTLL